jgi:PAS domain S-box-containing protein
MNATFDRVLATGGEAGALIARIDWASHPLGPIAGWPQSLRTALSICLASRTPILVWWGPELYEFYNDAYRPVLGATKHPRALGARGADIWPEIWHIMYPIFASILAGGRAIGHHDMFMFLDRNGFEEETFFDHAHCPVIGDHGEVAGIFTTVNETTGKVVGERRLRVLKLLAEQTVQAREVTAVCQLAARVLSGNAADVPYCLIYERRGERFELSGAAGLDVSDMRAVDPGRWPLARAAHTQGGEQVAADIVPLFDEQSLREARRAPTRAVVFPLGGSDGAQPSAALVVGLSPHLAFDELYRDFLGLAAGQIAASIASARASAEQQRRLNALEELDHAKTKFFHNISHEFRTPLTLMLGPTEDALASPQGALSGDSLLAVHRNALRLLRLVNTLLDFSRLEAGRLQPRLEASDLARLTRDHASAFESAFERAGLRLTLDCPTLSHAVYVDREFWEKIVLNLLSNALKFTLEGAVEVSLRESADGEKACLQVRDTGTGIPADELPQLFQRFHRVQGARARSHEGSGIGLALVHELVAMQGGTLEVETEFGHGTTFTVALPLSHEPVPARSVDVTAEPSAQRRSLSAEALHALNDASQSANHAARARPTETAQAVVAASELGVRASVLVAEDNLDMRDYLARILSPYYELRMSGNGRDALRAAHERTPDLILSDVMMPELDGFGLLRELRSDPNTRPIPFVLLSARAGEDARVEGLQAGADDYLIKPFAARELLARIATQVALGRARHAMRNAQERLRAIFQQAPVAVSVVRGPAFVFELANPRYEQMMGRRVMLGQRFRDVFPELLDDAPVLSMLEEVRATGRTFSASEYPVTLDRHGDGKLVDAFFYFSCQPLHESNQATDAILTVAIDVTEQVALRRELEALSKEREWLLGQEQRARSAAESANRVKDEFLAILGHELRNPLAPIATALTLLRQAGPVSKEQVIIERQVGHLTRLVADLLDVSRITRGKVDLKMGAVDVAQLVRQAVELASPLLEERDHRLTLDVPNTNLEVFGDATRLAQVLANLLTNAAKYTNPHGHIQVRAVALDDFVEIAVEDDGIGIEPAMLEYVFDAFAQEAQAIDRSRGGLGLGLTIARNLVALHGGSVAARSGGKGLGSEFSVRLPRYLPSTHRVSKDAEASPVTPHATVFKGRRVLVVDDNDDAAELLGTWFRSKGAEVCVVNDGVAALSAARDFRPQIGVIDIGLPALSGYEVARRLRADTSQRGLVLVAVTGYGQVSDRDKSKAAGFDAHCVKPLELAAFEPLVAELAARADVNRDS